MAGPCRGSSPEGSRWASDAVVAAEASGPGGEMAVGCHVRDKSCSKPVETGVFIRGVLKCMN